MRQGFSDGFEDTDKRFPFDSSYQTGYALGMKHRASKQGYIQVTGKGAERFLYRGSDWNWVSRYRRTLIRASKLRSA